MSGMDGSASGATTSGEEGEAMAERRGDGWKLGRREFLIAAAAAATLPPQERRDDFGGRGRGYGGTAR